MRKRSFSLGQRRALLTQPEGAVNDRRKLVETIVATIAAEFEIVLQLAQYGKKYKRRCWGAS